MVRSNTAVAKFVSEQNVVAVSILTDYADMELHVHVVAIHVASYY